MQSKMYLISLIITPAILKLKLGKSSAKWTIIQNHKCSTSSVCPHHSVRDCYLFLSKFTTFLDGVKPDKGKKRISKIHFLECDWIIGVCGSICKMLNESVTSAIQYDNQSTQWENQFYRLIELNQCLWTRANQWPSVASHHDYGSCFSLAMVGKGLTQPKFPQKESPALSHIFKFPWHLASN